MHSDSHGRARFLIDESRVAGISPEETSWLRGHIGGCAECARHEETTARIVRGLDSFSFEFDPSRTKFVRPVFPGVERKALIVGAEQNLFGSLRRRILAASIFVVLAALPIYQNVRAARQERADALLLEGVESRVSRTVPAAMEPLVRPQIGETR